MEGRGSQAVAGVTSSPVPRHSRTKAAVNDQDYPQDTYTQGELALPLADFHPRPQVSMGRDRAGRWTGTYRRDPETAWRDFRHVEHHTPTSRTGLYFDVDVPGGVHAAVFADRVPAPTVCITRKSNGHSAAGYLLRRPVHVYPGSRDKPRILLARVSEYLAGALQADPGYTDTLFRNALVAADDPRFIVERRDVLFDLEGLADGMPQGWQPPRVKCRTADGRNDSLHRGLIRLAGSAKHSEGDIRRAAAELNERYAVPLASVELAAIIRSVLRRRDLWMLTGWHSEGFRKRQAARGRLGGKASGAARLAKATQDAQKARELRAGGLTQREVAEALGVHRTTVYRMLHEANAR